MRRILLLLVVIFFTATPIRAEPVQSNTNTLAKIGSIGNAYGAFALVNNIAYVGTGDGLGLVDVSNPVAPTLLSTVPLRYPFGEVLRSERVTSVVVQEGRAYVASAFVPTLCCEFGTLRAIDVSNSRQPTILATYGGFNRAIFDFDVREGFAYVDGILPNYSGAIKIIDMRGSAPPQVVGEIAQDQETSGINSIRISGDYAYTTHSDGHLSIFQISDPTTPTRVNRIALPAAGRALAVADGRLYVAGKVGLFIYDLSTTETPRLLSTYVGAGDAAQMRVSGGRIFVANGAGVVVLDVTDPTQPLFVARYQSSGIINRVVAEGDLALVSPPPSSETTILRLQTVPPTTGTATSSAPSFSPNQRITFTFATNSLASPLDLSFRTPIGSDAIGNGILIGGDLFEITSRASVTEPAAPYTVTFDITVLAYPVSASTLALYHWDGTDWVKQPTTYDNATNRVTATTNRFGRFAWFGETPVRVLLPLVSQN